MAGRRYDVQVSTDQQRIREIEEDITLIGDHYREMMRLVREAGKATERLTRNQAYLVDEVRRRRPDR